jgi:hypothetical protein
MCSAAAARHEERAGHVDGEDAIEMLGGELAPSQSRVRRRHVDHAVRLAQGIHRTRHDRSAIRVIGDVGADLQKTGRIGRQLLRRNRLQVGCAHAMACRQQALHASEADPAGGAGDDHGFGIFPWHNSPLASPS